MTPAMLARAGFTPELERGDVLADQYEVVGCMATGGMGCIYLAWDRKIETYRVLKGLLDSVDAAAMDVANPRPASSPP